MVESTEQATPSPDAKSEQTTTPPGITEAINQFEADQAKQAAEAKAKEAPSEEKPETKAEETKPKEDTKPETKETKGETETDEKKPTSGSLTLNVDGKEVPLDLSNPEDLKKLETWGQQGYSFSQRNQSLNDREALIGTQEAVLKAVRDGKLVPAEAGKPPGEPEQAAPELDLGDLGDDYPEVAKYLTTLKQTSDEQTKAITFMNQIIAKNTMETAYKELTSRIDGAKKEHSLANDTEVWNMLKEVTDDKMPKYTPEEAVEISHTNEQKKLGGHIESDGYVKLTDEVREKVILEYKAKEAELAKAPVSTPSGMPAGSGTPSSDKKKGFTGITDAINAFTKTQEGASKAKKF